MNLLTCDQAPSTVFEWWRWLSSMASATDFRDRLKRSTLASSDPTLLVRRTFDINPEAWVFKACNGQSFDEFKRYEWFKRPAKIKSDRMLVFDEYYAITSMAMNVKLLMGMPWDLCRQKLPQQQPMVPSKIQPLRSTHTQTLADFGFPPSFFSNDEKQPTERCISLKGMLLWCGRVDLLDVLFEAQGGETNAHRQRMVDDLLFLEKQEHWSRDILVRVEEASLYLALPSGNVEVDRPRKRL